MLSFEREEELKKSDALIHENKRDGKCQIVASFGYRIGGIHMYIDYLYTLRIWDELMI